MGAHPFPADLKTSRGSQLTTAKGPPKIPAHKIVTDEAFTDDSTVYSQI